MKRRQLIGAIATAAIGSAGCVSGLFSLVKTPAHTVSVYNLSEKRAREVEVSVRNSADEILFERSYAFSESVQASESETFPASDDPATVLVTVDGNRYERQWPASDCDGLYVWESLDVKVFGEVDPERDVYTGGNCQTAYMGD